MIDRRRPPGAGRRRTEPGDFGEPRDPAFYRGCVLAIGLALLAWAGILVLAWWLYGAP